MLRTKDEFRASFHAFCSGNGDTKITKDSLGKWCKRNHVKPSHVDSFIMKHDLDGDEEVSYQEFVRFYLREEIQENFALYDTNRDGKVTKEELKRGLAHAGSDPALLDFVVGVVLKKMDVNNDGEISYDEFATYYVNTNYNFSENSD